MESMDNISWSSLANGLQMGLIQLEFEWDTHLRGANSPTINACNCANIDLWHTNIENSSLICDRFRCVSVYLFFIAAVVLWEGVCVCVCTGALVLNLVKGENGKNGKNNSNATIKIFNSLKNVIINYWCYAS